MILKVVTGKRVWRVVGRSVPGYALFKRRDPGVSGFNSVWTLFLSSGCLVGRPQAGGPGALPEGDLGRTRGCCVCPSFINNSTYPSTYQAVLELSAMLVPFGIRLGPQPGGPVAFSLKLLGPQTLWDVVKSLQSMEEELSP